MKRLLCLLLLISIVAEARFVRNDAGYVLDQKTRLIWQDDYPEGEVVSLGWTEAVSYCNDLDLAGKGWRLPSINELLSIVDYGRDDWAPVFPTAFLHAEFGDYWSSTTRVAIDPKQAWTINFYSGQARTWEKKDNRFYVRCVRDAVGE